MNATMGPLLFVEFCCVAGTGVIIGLALLAIRFGWRRGKGMRDQ